MEAVNSPQHPDDGSGNSLDEFLPLIETVGITVLDTTTGHIKCPGEELHTHPTAANHCKLYNNDGILRINCFHQSCRPMIEVFNRVLWKHTAAKVAGGQSVKGLPVRQVEGPLASQLRKGDDTLRKIFQETPWTYADIINDPAGKVSEPAPWHYLLLLSLFHADDILWIAHTVHCSGSPNFARNFRSAGEWMIEHQCPGTYICPNAFKPGVISRSNANVVHKRFLVVESDTLTKDQMGAVFRYLMALGYKLKAIVDTAGKSLHGWFDSPNDNERKRLSRELPHLGCDPQMFSVSQPVRLPGAVRNGQFQKLIYFNP